MAPKGRSPDTGCLIAGIAWGRFLGVRHNKLQTHIHSGVTLGMPDDSDPVACTAALRIGCQSAQVTLRCLDARYSGRREAERLRLAVGYHVQRRALPQGGRWARQAGRRRAARPGPASHVRNGRAAPGGRRGARVAPPRRPGSPCSSSSDSGGRHLNSRSRAGHSQRGNTSKSAAQQGQRSSWA